MEGVVTFWRLMNLHDIIFISRNSLGLLLLARNSLDDAHRHFKQVLGENPRSIPALLGMARIQIIRENYSQALTTYRQVLKLLPDCTPNPRIGMGICFYKLGMEDTATTAFRRCIEMVKH